MTPSQSLVRGLLSMRGFLAAFVVSVGYFVCAAGLEGRGSCFSWAHYLASALPVLCGTVLLVAVTRRPWREQPDPWLHLGQALSVGGWSALGLAGATFFAAVGSCTAG